MDDSPFLILKLITELQESKQGSAGMKTKTNPQWNTRDSLGIALTYMSIFDKDANIIQGGKAIFKKTMVMGKLGIHIQKWIHTTVITLLWQPKLTNIVGQKVYIRTTHISRSSPQLYGAKLSPSLYLDMTLKVYLLLRN